MQTTITTVGLVAIQCHDALVTTSAHGFTYNYAQP